MIRTGRDNLLLADVDALVNTVNCVGVMGKGIALQFRKAWPEMYREYKSACRAKAVVPGTMHVWPTDRLTGPRFIINFPTKRHWRANSRMEDIELGLEGLVRTIREHGIRSIAIPPLGAGNGRLDWAEVRTRIVRALQPLEDVDILLWEPGNAPPVEGRPVHTPPPEWTDAKAAVVALMGQYRVLDDDLTQLEVQKLAYFLQQAGAPLDLRFSPHHYGPYADGLYHMMQRMEGHFIRGLEDRNPAAVLRVDEDAVVQANQYLAEANGIASQFERVARLIEGFETPYGMEILGTLHWVAQGGEGATSADEAIEAVRAWSSSKRSRMRPRHLRKAWDRLVDQGWVADVPEVAMASEAASG